MIDLKHYGTVVTDGDITVLVKDETDPRCISIWIIKGDEVLTADQKWKKLDASVMVDYQSATFMLPQIPYYGDLRKALGLALLGEEPVSVAANKELINQLKCENARVNKLIDFMISGQLHQV